MNNGLISIIITVDNAAIFLAVLCAWKFGKAVTIMVEGTGEERTNMDFVDRCLSVLRHYEGLCETAPPAKTNIAAGVGA